MRLPRLVAALVAPAVVAAPLALAAPAPAADRAARTGTSEKAEREIAVAGVEPRPNTFFVKGRVVTGTYPAAELVMMRRPAGSTTWKAWRTFETDASSTFRVRVYGPPAGSRKVCYRVKAPSSKDYRTSFSQVLCIVRR